MEPHRNKEGNDMGDGHWRWTVDGDEWVPDEPDGRLVDDESLGDPRFIRSAWDVMRQQMEEGNTENVERVQRELGRSMEQGNDILWAEARPDDEPGFWGKLFGK